MSKHKSSKIAQAIAVGLLWAVIFTVMPVISQARLAEKMTRLHIIANSDSLEDQQLKLDVRDRVLELSAALEIDENEITQKLLDDLQKAAQDEVYARGYSYDVRIEKTRMFFETKQYDNFALPAGYYDAVRIVIGGGEGKNWWCVIFPPLCAGACEEDFAQAAKNSGLTDDEIAFIQEDGTQYIIRFKIVESIANFFEKR